MKVLIINASCGNGSTGRIVADLYAMLRSKGHICKVAYGHGEARMVPIEDTIRVNDKIGYYIHNFLGKLTDRAGFFSKHKTERFVEYIKEYNPDVVHLHNLHGFWINIEVLFKCLKELNKPVIWTLHDCWAFTGHCAHFDQFGCVKWKTGCSYCQHLYAYPKSWFIDNSYKNFIQKKQLVSQLGDLLTIVPVSYWLEGLVRQSFMKGQKIQTIHNGIDLTQFHPINNELLYDKYGVREKKIILGVALPWSGYKGLPDFHKIRRMLSNDYVIILVGLSEQQIDELPEGIIGITRTDSIKELSEIYTMADVFVNTTYCDNYPTVNLESIACGTPVITYNTGGSPEAVNQNTGLVVEQGDVVTLVESIKFVLTQNRTEIETQCISRAVSNFDKNKCFDSYLNLYKCC